MALPQSHVGKRPFFEMTNKKPAHRRRAAAGKHLIQMDLPLAWREPSPPDSVRQRVYPAPPPACFCALHHHLAAPQSTRPRFDFTLEHAHRQNFYSECSDKPSRNVLSRKE